MKALNAMETVKSRFAKSFLCCLCFQLSFDTYDSLPTAFVNLAALVRSRATTVIYSCILPFLSHLCSTLTPLVNVCLRCRQCSLAVFYVPPRLCPLSHIAPGLINNSALPECRRRKHLQVSLLDSNSWPHLRSTPNHPLRYCLSLVTSLGYTMISIYLHVPYPALCRSTNPRTIRRLWDVTGLVVGHGCPRQSRSE